MDHVLTNANSKIPDEDSDEEESDWVFVYLNFKF